MSNYYEQFSYLAKLCRIELAKEDQEKLQNQFAQILSYIDQLKELDTERVKAYRGVIDTVSSTTREDVAQEILPREAFLENAPDHVGGMIRIPPVIKFD
ncbi:MAG: Asp-tRNA(Asn)/Glu-tRNA(Gln) amidotransferase subunit GatC [Chlamydiae bacterium]|nr:Asp-tRNA(Asn)/Glu-tRNA(Gln) amidotransferase subunit GatC [Chlamydiota bacterium]